RRRPRAASTCSLRRGRRGHDAARRGLAPTCVSSRPRQGRSLMLRVLVVDDNPDHRFLAARVLKGLAAEMPLDVAFAQDGDDALARLARETPDLVLLDIKMPRVSGFDVLEATRRDPRTASLPIVVFTSSEAGADVERARALGASGF